MTNARFEFAKGWRQGMDVAVIGGGPAGCALAVAAARAGVSVRLIETGGGQVKPGEVLAPGAAQDLEDLGLGLDLLARDHLACSGIDRIWGGPEVARVDFAARMQGGWHLDRPVFEDAMIEACRGAGVEVELGVAVTAVDRAEAGWRLHLSDGRRVRAGFLVDASGRRAVVAGMLGVRSRVQDRLVAFHAVAGCVSGAGAQPMFIEAVENGWWYTAPLAGGRRVFAFLTDSDLPAAHLAARAEGFRQLLGETRMISRFPVEALSKPRAHVATSRRLERFSGPGWLALGDAAIGRDPLSGGGIACALRDGRKAAAAIATCPKGGVAPLEDFDDHLEGVWDSHERERRDIYAREGRWPWSPFWARRGGDEEATALRGQA